LWSCENAFTNNFKRMKSNEDLKRNVQEAIKCEPLLHAAEIGVTVKLDFNNLILDEIKFKIKSMEINNESADFAPSYYKDKIVFTSSRSTPSMLNRKYNWNGQPFLNIYESDLEGSQLKEPKNFSRQINSKKHDGPASFNEDGTLMAFTKNNEKDRSKDKIVELQIHFSSSLDGKWSDPVPFIFNSEEYSVGHPHLSKDGNTMYFTSNMNGGFGGTDLYSTSRERNGEWNKPVNMGNKINTEGDEMFPFYEEKNGIFFFSSNGHSGFGGLDVFMCMVDSSKVGRVSNIGYPLNTKNDDYAFIVNDSLKNGFFSSNRSSEGIDNIYSVELMGLLDNGKKLQGIAKNKNGVPLVNTYVTLCNDKSIFQDSLTTQEDGSFLFLVDSKKQFELLGEKTGYIDGTSKPNTNSSEMVIISDLVLFEKFKIDSSLLIVGTDLSKVVNEKAVFEGDLKMNVAYFDLDKSNIRPDAAKELDKIVAVMNEFSTIVIALSSYTDCSASERYNQDLSNRRAISSVEYIQLRISKPERISGIGKGEKNLLNSCDCEGSSVSGCPDSENQINRRTEFIITKKNI
jgi:outer membrane protein OmpA-like peptidoglycan-associated protein